MKPLLISSALILSFMILVHAEDSAIRYEFTIRATPMPDVKDCQKAFDWPTEGENFTVWIRYKVTNTSATPARAKLYIRVNPTGSAGTHYVDMLLKPGESLEQAACYPFFPLKGRRIIIPGCNGPSTGGTG